MVCVILALNMDDIQPITRNKKKREKLVKHMIVSIRDKFLDVDDKVIKQLIDSIIGNMTNCATNDDLPKGIDMEKIIVWHLH